MTALPGLTPRSPEMIEGPVLVTVWPANIAKEVAVPSPTGGWAADATPPKMITAVAVAMAAPATNQRRGVRAWVEVCTDVTNFPSPWSG